MANVALAFAVAKQVQQGADSAPERFERAGLGLAKLCSIGLKSGLYGGKYRSTAPAPSMAA